MPVEQRSILVRKGWAVVGNLRRGLAAVLIVAGGLIGYNVPAASQSITVRGRVVEHGTAEAVAGATAELSGAGRTITNPRGEFIFSLPRPGRRNLTVTMLGYRQHKSSIQVQSDTTVLVELDVDAVRLPGVTVRNRRYRLRGQVTDAENRQPVIDADVRIDRRDPVHTNIAGRFNVGGLSAGNPITIHVSAFGLMPRQLTLQADRDTTINLALRADPIGQRMIAIQLQRLESRSNALGHSVQTLNRDQIMRRSVGTPWDLIREYLRPSLRKNAPASITLETPAVVPCLFIDERRVQWMEELTNYVPDTIERIEIIDRGSMVRVYTRRYVQEMLRRRADPAPIVLVAGLGPTVCH